MKNLLDQIHSSNRCVSWGFGRFCFPCRSAHFFARSTVRVSGPAIHPSTISHTTSHGHTLSFLNNAPNTSVYYANTYFWFLAPLSRGTDTDASFIGIEAQPPLSFHRVISHRGGSIGHRSEANDILAALRASQRVVKGTREVVMGLRPRTEQVKDFAEILHAHERDFTTWIYEGAGILPTTRLAIRSLPLFSKLVVYINLLKDLQSDLAYVAHSSSTSSATRGSFLRRLSSATPSQSRTNSHSLSTPPLRTLTGAEKDPRLAVVINKVVGSFGPLKESIILFAEDQRKQRAYGDARERTRKELGIPHELCLQGTRQNIRSFIKSWIDPSHSSSPGSTLAATLACEWKRSASLGAHLFISPPRPTSAKTSSTGKRSSEEESEADKAKAEGPLACSSSFSRALSRIAYRRELTSSVKVKARVGGVGSFLETLNGLSVSEEKGKRALVIVDGLDHASEEDSKRVVGAVKGAVERDAALKVVLTTPKKELATLSGLKAAEMVDFVDLHGGAISLSGDREGKSESGEGRGDADDIRRYVASRLAVLLLPVDQERVVEAVQGNFADAVRICRDIGETGAPERALDGVLYREAVRRHGMEHVKVILV